MEMSNQLHALAALPRGNTPLPEPIVEEGGWASELIWTLWRREKSVTLAGNPTSILHFQPVA
jgi:hypothetical protein